MGIKPYDIVEVSFIRDPHAIGNPAMKLQGQTFMVKRRKDVTSYRGVRGSYYELYGAESKYGIPYGFTEDQLIRRE